MFNIKTVDVLKSKTGKGLKIGNRMIGCARITEIELPEGATLKQVAEADGLTLSYDMVNPSNIVPNQRPNIDFNTKDLTKADNYVLVIIDEDETTTVVTHCSQITELFDLPEEDGDALMKYIGDLAATRNLAMLTTEDLDDNPFFFFVNTFDQTMFELYLKNDQENLFANYVQLSRSPEFYAELTSHNFIKMFLVGVVKASQDRYNQTHRDKILCDIAKQIRSIRYWDDGKLLAPSMKDCEDYFTEIKNQIIIN